MSFTLKITDRLRIEALFTFLAAVTDDILLEFQESGIVCRTTDKQQISLVDVNISKDTFSDYTGNFPAVVGLNTGYILKALKSGSKDDTLSITYSGSDKLKLTFVGPQRNFDVCINLIDVSMYSGVPKIPTDHIHVVMPTELFVSSIHNLSAFSEDVRVLYTGGKLSFQVPDTDSNDFSGTSISYNEDLPITNDNGASDIREMFILRYMDLFGKMAKVAFYNVNILVRKDTPLVLTADDQCISVSFYIAPKIDTDAAES